MRSAYDDISEATDYHLSFLDLFSQRYDQHIAPKAVPAAKQQFIDFYDDPNMEFEMTVEAFMLPEEGDDLWYVGYENWKIDTGIIVEVWFKGWEFSHVTYTD